MSTLSQYLKETGTTQAQFADLIGVHQGTVARLASGTRGPSWELAHKIEQVSGGAVPVSCWPADLADAAARASA